MRLRNLTFCLLFVLALQARAWAVIAVTFDAPTTTIQVTGGTSGAPATWEDVYQADVAGGWGVVERVVQDAMYRTTASLNIGDGSTATHFTSLNEMIYFADGYKFEVKSAATLQIGELSGAAGVNGSFWRFSMPGDSSIIAGGSTTANFLNYGSRLKSESRVRVRYNHVTVDSRLEGFWWHIEGTPGTYTRTTFSTLQLNTSPTFTDCVFTGTTINNGGVNTLSDPIFVNTPTLRASNEASFIISSPDGAFTPDIQTDEANNIVHSEPVNIHITDRDGANLATATVACTSFGNIVSNDAGSTFYRCIVDHTAGTFATDVSAGKWELTTAANAALAGVTGAAKNGAWVTGIDYVKAAQIFSVLTDANGDIAEQTVDYKKWIGTSEAMLSYSPHTFTDTKAGYPTSTWDNAVIDAPTQQTIKMIGGVIVIDD